MIPTGMYPLVAIEKIKCPTDTCGVAQKAIRKPSMSDGSTVAQPSAPQGRSVPRRSWHRLRRRPQWPQ